MKVDDFQLLKTTPFVYGAFKGRINGFYSNMQHNCTPASRTNHPSSQNLQYNTDTSLYTWPMHSYLGSVGKCHYCKKHCGNLAGTCPGLPKRTRVQIPASFVIPPKPSP